MTKKISKPRVRGSLLSEGVFDIVRNKGYQPAGIIDNCQQGVAEDARESYIIVRTDTEGKKDVFAGNFDTYDQAQKELDSCLAHPLHTKYKQKFEIKRQGEQDVSEGFFDMFNSRKQSMAEAPLDWQGTYSGTKQAATTDHTFDEANKYIKANYPFAKTYKVRRAEPGFRVAADPSEFRRSEAHVTDVDGAVDYLQLKPNAMMSGSQQVTLSIGYSWMTLENPSTGIAILYYQDRGMGADEITIGGKTQEKHLQAKQVFRDAGVLPAPRSVSKKGVAEGSSNKLPSFINYVLSNSQGQFSDMEEIEDLFDHAYLDDLAVETIADGAHEEGVPALKWMAPRMKWLLQNINDRSKLAVIKPLAVAWMKAVAPVIDNYVKDVLSDLAEGWSDQDPEQRAMDATRRARQRRGRQPRGSEAIDDRLRAENEYRLNQQPHWVQIKSTGEYVAGPFPGKTAANREGWAYVNANPGTNAADLQLTPVAPPEKTVTSESVARTLSGLVRGLQQQLRQERAR